MAQPTTPITNPAFEYRNAAATDVTQTWRRFGWVPKDQQPVERMRVGAAGITWRDQHGKVTMHLPADGTFASNRSKPSAWAGVVKKVDFDIDLSEPREMVIGSEGLFYRYPDGRREFIGGKP